MVGLRRFYARCRASHQQMAKGCKTDNHLSVCVVEICTMKCSKCCESQRQGTMFPVWVICCILVEKLDDRESRH